MKRFSKHLAKQCSIMVHWEVTVPKRFQEQLECRDLPWRWFVYGTFRLLSSWFVFDILHSFGHVRGSALLTQTCLSQTTAFYVRYKERLNKLQRKKQNQNTSLKSSRHKLRVCMREWVSECVRAWVRLCGMCVCVWVKVCVCVCVSVCMSFTRISLQRLKTKRWKLQSKCNATISWITIL